LHIFDEIIRDIRHSVGISGGLEKSKIDKSLILWWACLDSNQEPDRYERPDPAMPRSRSGTFALWRALSGGLNKREGVPMFRWAVISLIISLIAGGLGLTTVSVFAKRLSLIFFALFFLGFLALVGFAYLVSSAVNHSDLLPALVAVSV